MAGDQVDKQYFHEIGDREDSDSANQYKHNLFVAKILIIADDIVAQELFGDLIYSAPQEDKLEGACFAVSVPLNLYVQAVFIYRVL